jgi:hypothetical protein
VKEEKRLPTSMTTFLSLPVPAVARKNTSASPVVYVAAVADVIAEIPVRTKSEARRVFFIFII